MSRLGRVRKAVVTAVGMAVTVVLLVPQDVIPQRLRPYVAGVLVLGTIAGVYQTPNDTPPRSRRDRADQVPPPTRAARPEERPRRFEGP
jgi:hypothetical protein